MFDRDEDGSVVIPGDFPYYGPQVPVGLETHAGQARNECTKYTPQSKDALIPG